MMGHDAQIANRALVENVQEIWSYIFTSFVLYLCVLY